MLLMLKERFATARQHSILHPERIVGQIGSYERKEVPVADPCEDAIARQTCHPIHDRSCHSGGCDEQERFAEAG